MRAPKIGTIIPVKENGKYTGMLNTDRSGEVLQTVEKTKKDLILFHSSDFPLFEFRAQDTCFYEGYAVSGYVYAAYIPVGTEIRRYPGNEVRLILTPEIKIKYIGRIISKYENLRPGYVKEINRYTGLVKKYLQMQNERVE